MAKISALPALSVADVDGTETLPVVKAGITRRLAAGPYIDRLAAPYVAAAEAAVGAQTYESIAEGFADTADGQGFAVDNGDGTVVVYRNQGGGAVFQRHMATVSWLNAQLAPLVGQDMGTVGTGSTQGLVVDRSFVGSADGSSVLYGEVRRLRAEGPNPINMARTHYSGLDITATAPVTVATGEHRYVWNKGAAPIDYARVYEGHIRNDGPGSIGIAYVYNTVGVTLGGPVTQIVGYNAGTLGDETHVTQAYCFNASDQPQCLGITVAYRSEMTAGNAANKKFAFLASGNAPNAFLGKVMIGDTVEASAGLHVKDNRADFGARLENAHPATPWGLRIHFTGSAPNNTTQEFLRCEDQASMKLRIASNGSVSNALNAYGAISDIKLKRDIEDAGDQVADVRAFRMRRYRLIADGDDGPFYLGGIAQEVEQTSPGLVFSTPDFERYFEQAYEPGGVGEPALIPLIGQGEWKERPTGTVTKNINYSVLYLKAVGALQKAWDRIDELASRISALENSTGAPS